METHVAKFDHILTTLIIPFAWKILGAFAVWILGGICIRTLQRILRSALNKRTVDPTLTTYASKTMGVALKILLVVAILGIFGIETTSFSAILAAAGVAIGIAWSGLLSNFAAGVFLILLRPFKVGDAISAAGVTGTVREIGLFATTIDTGDNLRIFVGNNKLFSDNILNYSSNAYRIATFKIQLSSEVNPSEALERFKSTLVLVPGVNPTPEVGGDIAELNTQGTLIQMRAACAQSDYPQVIAEGYKAIHETLRIANYPPIENKMVLVQK